MTMSLQGFNEVVLNVCLPWCWKEIHSVEDRERTWKQGYQVSSHHACLIVSDVTINLACMSDLPFYVSA